MSAMRRIGPARRGDRARRGRGGHPHPRPPAPGRPRPLRPHARAGCRKSGCRKWCDRHVTVFTLRDATVLADLLAETATVEIMPRFRRLGAGEIRAKTGPLDLVTEADEIAELAITAGLRQRFPGCVVVGEEATAADPAVLG